MVETGGQRVGPRDDFSGGTETSGRTWEDGESGCQRGGLGLAHSKLYSRPYIEEFGLP